MSFDITWIGQGGYVFYTGDKTVCIDPYLSDSVGKAGGPRRLVPVPIDARGLKVDMVISTHDHADHLDEESIRCLSAPGTLFAGPATCLKHFRSMGIQKNSLYRLNAGDSFSDGDLEINAVYANHTPDSIGVVIKHSGYTVYLTGDTLYDKKLLDTKRYVPDILIACINGKMGNMGYEEAAALAFEIRVKVAIPSHYGMFAENTVDPEKFREELKNSSVRYFDMKYGRKYSVEDIINR